MKITQVLEQRDQKSIALMSARRVLNSLRGFMQDISAGQFKGMTVEAMAKLLIQYQTDVESALTAIEAIREGKATPEQVKLILEFDTSALGKQLMESK